MTEISRREVLSTAILAANRIKAGRFRAMAGLKTAREAAGLSQLEAADRIGCRKVTYQQWEHGRHWPSAYYLPQIATAFHCTIEELYLPPVPEKGGRP